MSKLKWSVFLAAILLVYSVRSFWSEYVSLEDHYQSLALMGGPVIAKYYLSEVLWKQVFIDLAVPALAFSLSLYLVRDHVCEPKRKIIKIGMAVSSAGCLPPLSCSLPPGCCIIIFDDSSLQAGEAYQ